MTDRPDQPRTTLPTALAGELRVLVGQLRRRLRAQASPDDFTPSQVAVLIRLEAGGPATVTALAQAEGVRPQSMGATVAVLQAAGYVSGTSDPSDGRRTILSLTDRVRAELAASRAAKEDWLSRAITTHLTSAEQEELASAVQLLKRLADS